MTIDPIFFEAIMLICFGAAWPISICKMIRTKHSAGKSIGFLAVIWLGYFSGILFEWFGARDAVTWLYVFNMLMVLIDMALSIRYRKGPVTCAS